MVAEGKSLLERLFGDSVQVKILEALLEGGKTDVSIKTLVSEADIGKSRTYEVIEELKKKGYIIPSRKVANKQLYKLNFDNEVIKALDTLYRCLIKFD